MNILTFLKVFFSSLYLCFQVSVKKWPMYLACPISIRFVPIIILYVIFCHAVIALKPQYYPMCEDTLLFPSLNLPF